MNGPVGISSIVLITLSPKEPPIFCRKLPITPFSCANFSIVAVAALYSLLPTAAPLESFIADSKALTDGPPIFSANKTGFATKSPAYGIAEISVKTPKRVFP